MRFSLLDIVKMPPAKTMWLFPGWAFYCDQHSNTFYGVINEHHLSHVTWSFSTCEFTYIFLYFNYYYYYHHHQDQGWCYFFFSFFFNDWMVVISSWKLASIYWSMNTLLIDWKWIVSYGTLIALCIYKLF